jgi:energy-coupling factor transporter ATP-binding protein EcfA2
MPKLLSYGYQSDRTLVEVISRRDFLREFGRDYRDGHHVTGIGPSGRGKSTLFYQCLQQVVTPDRMVFSLHGKRKGRDPTVERAAKMLNLRIVTELPTAARIKYDSKRKFNGYIIRPLETAGPSVAADNDKLRKEYEPVIHHVYATPPGHKKILHVNETHQTHVDLKLKTECEGPLMRGAPDAMEWNEIQRGRNVSYMCYDSPEHMFIFKDDDNDNVRRYADFGTGDAREIAALIEHLRTDRAPDGRTISQCLYMRRSGGMFVVDT